MAGRLDTEEQNPTEEMQTKAVNDGSKLACMVNHVYCLTVHAMTLSNLPASPQGQHP